VSEPPVAPSYEELAARVEVQDQVIAELRSMVEELRAEVAALRRQVGRDSSNSSQPPGQDGPGARAKAKADKRSGGSAEGPKRSQGGQKGHPGAGLARVANPDRTVSLEPVACTCCGAGLAGAPGRVGASVQVFDLPTFSLQVTEYLMMRRVCGCGQATTAQAPPGIRGGPTCYGPNVTAAATLLASTDVIGIERAAELMSALLGVEVSTGFVSGCLVRLDDALDAAGFEAALKDALRAADVLGTDETPAPLTEAATREPGCHNPHVYTVRTMCAYTGGGPDLVWYGAAGDRTKASISSFGILDAFGGVLVRDDYGGYLSYDTDLAAVQQCAAHALRYLDDAHAIDPTTQGWAAQVADALREAIHAVNTARAEGRTSLHPRLLARLRATYDAGVAVGISTNLSRRWHKGNHPGLQLARRLQRKADQVWVFVTRFDVPATNNGSEAAIRGYKIAAKISGCWRTLATLQRHCRIRSYLTSARNHGRRAVEAITDALTGNAWMPPTPA
jgi:transposase